MKAVIMAGGEGSRLRPLTCDCPKPMVPVLDRPVMHYALTLLKHHGVKKAAVTLMYLPERVTSFFGDGRDWDVELTYYTETMPLGTAGSVAQASEFLDETFVVLSGDGLTDCDLTDALKFHRATGALATMVMKKVASPLEYGVVLTDADGRVQRFVEKPGWGEVCSDAVNTGIYILEPAVFEYIPKDRPYDFGRELFPELVQKGLKVFGYLMQGYWCDIGDTAAYLRAHMDLLDGKMSGLGRLRMGGVNKCERVTVDKSAVLESPCYIGSGARVEAGARVGPYTVLGAGSYVGKDASVKRSVLWRGAHVEERGQLRGAVLQNGAKVGKRACVFEESVLGDGATLGDGAVLMPNVKIWPKKEVADGERVDQNIVWGRQSGHHLRSGTFAVETPAQAVRDAQAFAEGLGVREVVVGRDASNIASAIHRAVISGLMAQGVQVVDIGAVTLPQLRYALESISGQSAIYTAREWMIPLSGNGICLSRAQERKVMGQLSREDYPMPFCGVTRCPIRMTGTDLTYTADVARLSGACFDRESTMHVAVFSQQEQMLSMSERVFRYAGLNVRAEWEEELMDLAPGEVGIWLNERGEMTSVATEEGALSEAEKLVLIDWAALETGSAKLIARRGTTRCLNDLAQRYGVEVLWTGSSREAFEYALMAEDAHQFRLHTDGIAAALTIFSLLQRDNLTIKGVLRMVRRVERRTQIIPVRLKDKGRLMQQLSGAMPNADITDGIIIERDNGWAFIDPAGDRRECVVTAESYNVEFARELCDLCTKEIERAMKKL